MSYTNDEDELSLYPIDHLNLKPKLEWGSLTHTTQRIAEKIMKATERTNYILGTLSTEYTQ